MTRLRDIIDEDLTDVFHNDSDFNTEALFDGATTIYGYFDDEYIAIALTAGVEMESTVPMFKCPLASVPGIVHGKTLLINGTTYTVHETQPDGLGSVVLLLDK